MDQFGISELADWLEANTTGLLAKTTPLDEDKVQAAVDYLGVLAQPAATYLTTLQGTYFQAESDHKLNLLADDLLLADLEDRIMVNHVDGSITEGTIHFTYNHEPVFDQGYQAKRDLNIVKYGLEVIGAVATSGQSDPIKKALSQDAMVTLVVAAHQFKLWQQA